MIKLVDLLREVGEGSSRPYPMVPVKVPDYDSIDSFEVVAYKFDTEVGEYKVVIDKEMMGSNDYGSQDYNLKYMVTFGIEDEEGWTDYKQEFKDVKNAFRVMATVVEAIKKTIEDDKDRGLNVARLLVEPSKREIEDPETGDPVTDEEDTRRANLYKKYIEKHMPAGSQVRAHSGGEYIIVDFPNSPEIDRNK